MEKRRGEDGWQLGLSEVMCVLHVCCTAPSNESERTGRMESEAEGGGTGKIGRTERKKRGSRQKGRERGQKEERKVEEGGQRIKMNEREVRSQSRNKERVQGRG